MPHRYLIYWKPRMYSQSYCIPKLFSLSFFVKEIPYTCGEIFIPRPAHPSKGKRAWNLIPWDPTHIRAGSCVKCEEMWFMPLMSQNSCGLPTSLFCERNGLTTPFRFATPLVKQYNHGASWVRYLELHGSSITFVIFMILISLSSKILTIIVISKRIDITVTITAGALS